MTCAVVADEHTKYVQCEWKLYFFRFQIFFFVFSFSNVNGNASYFLARFCSPYLSPGIFLSPFMLSFGSMWGINASHANCILQKQNTFWNALSRWLKNLLCEKIYYVRKFSVWEILLCGEIYYVGSFFCCSFFFLMRLRIMWAYLNNYF